MKQLFIFAFVAICSTSFAQSNQSATVNTHQGVPVFIMAQPTAKYEITGTVNPNDFGSWLDAINGKKDERTIQQLIDKLIDNANRKARKGKFVFDAIITTDGRTGTLIKFVQEKAKTDTTSN